MILRARTLKSRRRTMVQDQLARRGISDKRVLAVMAWLPRDAFVPSELRESAYADTPLPIGDGQTISQPYIVALMTEHAQLTRQSKVLEVGTGSGYQTAILAKMGKHVWSIERVAAFIPVVHQRLERFDLSNVTLIVGDGSLGHDAHAPYDAIVVAAAAKNPPHALLEQLALGGRLVIPVGDQTSQMLTVFERREDRYLETPITECRFVPFVTGNN